MAAITRKGDNTSGICDIGAICCPHGRTGTNGKVSNNVFVNGLGVHRRSDTGPIACPHGGTFQSTGSSSSVFVNGLGVTRTGDSTVCIVCGMGGSHSGGSPNVFAG